MKKAGLIFVLLFFYSLLFSQTIECDNTLIRDAYSLAIQTVRNNTRNNILAAGADYGGEWTRDIAINSWNGVSLLMPRVAEESLWSVTTGHDTIGHQYWDKIIWVIAAYNHYQCTGDEEFLRQAYLCSANTMKQLEGLAFDNGNGLFAGPSVFNDGIAGYPEPYYDKRIESSFVLDHTNTKSLKCLSTNCVYYGAYCALAKMAALTGDPGAIHDYEKKAICLKRNILRNLSDKNHLYYFIDGSGRPDLSQEGLGLSFALIFGIIDGSRAHQLIRDAHVSEFGLTSIYPDFPYFSREKPGRHNNIVWPMVNGFFARAARISGNEGIFTKELFNLAHLATDPDKGNNDFREIYNPYTGRPDGGWQLGSHWNSCHHQTWSATAFISMVHYGLAGIRIHDDRMSFEPLLPEGISSLKITDICYQQAELTITLKGKGQKIRTFLFDGKKMKKHSIPAGIIGKHEVVIEVE